MKVQPKHQLIPLTMSQNPINQLDDWLESLDEKQESGLVSVNRQTSLFNSDWVSLATRIQMEKKQYEKELEKLEQKKLESGFVENELYHE